MPAVDSVCCVACTAGSRQLILCLVRPMPRLTTIAAVSMIVFAAVVSAAPADPRIRELRWLDRADVKADFRRHVVQRKDTRFIGIYGVGMEMPGLDDATAVRALRSEHVRFIRTSDVITSSEYLRLVVRAREYARRYNTMLLQYGRDRPKA